MRPIVLLDCDGPLAGFTAAYLRALEIETGAKHTPEEVDRWDIAGCEFFGRAADKIGIARRELKVRVDSHVSRPGFCEGIEVQPEALEAVRLLAEVADVYVLTSPWHTSRLWMYERTRWLRDHFELPAHRVIHASSKELVRGDVFVDDKPSHVEAWGRAWPASAAILFDMHHNRGEGESLRRGRWSVVFEAVRASQENVTPG